MRNLSKEFEQRKVCISVNSTTEIDILLDVIHNSLYIDVAFAKSRLQHGVYSRWFTEGYMLCIGLPNEENFVEVLSKKYFTERDYDVVDKNEFIENLRMW